MARRRADDDGSTPGTRHAGTFTERYLADTKVVIDGLDRGLIEQLVTELVALRTRGGRLFVVGSGGGAGHASHAVNDFRKIVGIEAYTPTDNVSELTARINDDGWESSYVDWLRVSRLGRRDMLLVFSVGGGDRERRVSVNLVNCVDYAKEVGAIVTGIVGRDGGHTARSGDVVIVIPQAGDGVTAQTESAQALLWHLLVSHPRLQIAAMKWESLR